MQLSNKAQTRLRDRYGAYALVTGATSGIGQELAQQLAQAGFGLVIQGRNEAVLEEMQAQLTRQHDIEVKTVAADLSHAEGVQAVIAATRHLPLGLLVASAGYGTSGTFLQNSVHAEQNMMRVNMEALMLLTHHYGQHFAQQKRGGIILMSSMVAFQGTPFAANYAATKAYVQGLAEGLHVELKPHGVDVLAAAPGPVATGFAQRANMQMDMVLTPEQIGVPILKALGRKMTVLPGRLTKVLVYALRTAPRSLKVRIMNPVMGGMTRHQRVVSSPTTA